jgi:diphthine-ammonia ligase
MKFVALVSGGKDSVYSIVLAREQGHELVACVHLARPAAAAAGGEDRAAETTEEESYMYQTAASEAVRIQVEECLGVPLIFHRRTGSSINTTLVYGGGDSDNDDDADEYGNDDDDNGNGNNRSRRRKRHDEVEDLHDALRVAVRRFPQVEAVCSGAILSTYQRIRIEHVACARLKLHSLAYLWRYHHGNQRQILQEMLLLHGTTTTTAAATTTGPEGTAASAAGMEAVLVRCAAPPGLIPRRHLGRTLRDLQPLFHGLHSKFGFHVCGEGGEYETLVLYCPGLFHRRLVLDEVQVDDDDGIGELVVLRCHSEAIGQVEDGRVMMTAPPQEKDAMKSVSLLPKIPVATTTGIIAAAATTSTTSSTAAEREGTNMATAALEDSASITEESRQRVCDGNQKKSSDRQEQNGAGTLSYAPTKNIHTKQLVQPPPTAPPLFFLPQIRRLPGGLWGVSEMMSPAAASAAAVGVGSSLSSEGGGGASSEADCAAQEAIAILNALRCVLLRMHCSAHDVLFVHLYLSEISHFASINGHYRDTFGVLLPPSRSTVAVGRNVLPGGRRIMLDCVAQCGSGTYLRTTGTTQANSGADNNTADVREGGDMKQKSPYAWASHASMHASRLREVLHVQSISHWAPVCVGPYSQVNTLRGGLHFCAGQIGLVPATMTLRSTWSEQLDQCWTNLASVLDALDSGSICDLISCLLYVSESVWDIGNSAAQIGEICAHQMDANGGIVAVAEHSNHGGSDFDGYEDEETRLAVEGDNVVEGKPPPCPILVVAIPGMPVGALTEIEAIAATRAASLYLKITDASSSQELLGASTPRKVIEPFDWDTGHDFVQSDTSSQPVDLQIETSFRFLGRRDAACAIVTAATEIRDTVAADLDLGLVLRQMLLSLKSEPDFDSESILHLRLYYVVSSDSDNDGLLLRAAFQVCLGTAFGTTAPATTVVPVRGMSVLNTASNSPCRPFLALHAISIDPVRLEQSIWIRHGR